MCGGKVAHAISSHNESHGVAESRVVLCEAICGWRNRSVRS
jgi:hypothetical protein